MKCVSPADNPQAVTSDLSNLFLVLFFSYVNTTLTHDLSLHYQALYIWQHFILRTVSQVTQNKVMYRILLHSSSGIIAQVLINTELLAHKHKRQFIVLQPLL
jgi:hypothetical protein